MPSSVDPPRVAARGSMPGVQGYEMVPLEGGWSGETFLAEAAGERSVVRIYAGRGARRGPRAVEIDAAVLRLVRGLLPVPEVLGARLPEPGAGSPALLVTSFLPGERLDLVLPSLSEELQVTVGTELGTMLGRLAQMPMLHAGRFSDDRLHVEAWPDADDLPGWVETCRRGTALALWPAAEYDALLEVADVGQRLLDRVRRVSLVHSDVNPKNILVDPATGRVTGLVDWEFAHAGLPVADLGNLLRFDRLPGFADPVLTAYRAGVRDAGEDVLDLARAADLYALVDLAGRRGENPVTERAYDLLRAVARSGDLHARP